MTTRPVLDGSDAGGRAPLVPVAQAYGMPQASLALNLLQANGIPAHADTWHTASAAWHWSHAVGGITLRVPAAHAQEAARVLAKVEPAPPARRWKLVLFFLAALWWAGVPPPPRGMIALQSRAQAGRRTP